MKEPLEIDFDEFGNEEPYIDRLKRTWMAKENTPVIFLSAEKKINIAELRDTIKNMVMNVSGKTIHTLYDIQTEDI